jgi:hypothetical protein
MMLPLAPSGAGVELDLVKAANPRLCSEMMNKEAASFPEQIQLTLAVDGEVWEQVKSFKDSGPHDKVFVVTTDEDGNTHVLFGDGEHGASLTTGQKNVTATYRYGLGKAGRKRKICFDLG